MVVTTRSQAFAKGKTGVRTDRKNSKRTGHAQQSPTTRSIPPRKRQRLCGTDSNVESRSEESNLEGISSVIVVPQFKTDIAETAFFGSVENDQDYISFVPPEVMYSIFEHTVLDHDPKRALKEHSAGHNFRPEPHALLGLAAMSRRFKALAEDFSRRFLTKHREIYHFQTDAELCNRGRRRSARIEASGFRSSRVYRMELVTAIRSFCIQCGQKSDHFAIMFNSVACHPHCETEAFPSTLINLTEALQNFDLRDYMLLKDRVPGPRAKYIDLPSIPYGTVWTRMGFGLSSGLSYRFNFCDVEKIARLVHGDVEAHMARKRHESMVRFSKKRKAVWISLKARYHTHGLESVRDGSALWFYHEKGLAKVETRMEEDDSVLFHECLHHTDYGDYDDIHARVCAVDPCGECEEEKFLRYLPWLRYDG